MFHVAPKESPDLHAFQVRVLRLTALQDYFISIRSQSTRWRARVSWLNHSEGHPIITSAHVIAGSWREWGGDATSEKVLIQVFGFSAKNYFGLKGDYLNCPILTHCCRETLKA